MTDAEIIKQLKIKKSDRILDVGGSMRQHTDIQIDTIADLLKPEESPYEKSKLKARNFVRVDITREKLPFADREFDICLCTHTLEDLPNPFFVMDEIQRVAKRGLIVTPSMGRDMVFSHYDLTDWLTGARRQPGEAHHKWFFVKHKNNLELIPKFYPILYTRDFQISDWNGESEMILVWKDKINYEIFSSINIHSLIDRYHKFITENKNYIKKSRVLFYIDNPLVILKAYLKMLIKRGNGYLYRKNY